MVVGDDVRRDGMCRKRGAGGDDSAGAIGGGGSLVLAGGGRVEADVHGACAAGV